MPIEFRCPNCGQLLRTPDESAGKQARCPQCQQIAPVPMQSAQAPPPAPSLENPFGDASAAPKKPVESGAFNPYAAPKAYEQLAPVAQGGELNHQVINMGDVLNVSWGIFTAELGQCAIVGLIFIAVNIGLSVVGGLLGGIGQVVAGDSVGIIIGAQVVNQTINFVGQTWLWLGLAAWALKMLRTRNGTINDMFSVGPFFLRGLGAGLLIYLVMGLAGGVLIGIPVGIGAAMESEEVMLIGGIAGGAIFLIIAILVFYAIALYAYFIIDRNASVMESFQLSAEFTRGNRLTMFAIYLVLGLAGGLFTVCTCYLGAVLFIPYMALAMALIYLMATGQAYAPPPLKQTM